MSDATAATLVVAAVAVAAAVAAAADVVAAAAAAAVAVAAADLEQRPAPVGLMTIPPELTELRVGPRATTDGLRIAA